MLWTPHNGLREWSNIGADALTANYGTLVTTGSPASAKGAVAEVTASVPFDVFLLRIVLLSGATPATASQGSFDVLLGAAGSEQVIVSDLLWGYTKGKFYNIPIYIPAGARLSLQAANARTALAIRFAVHLLGGNASPPFRVAGKVITYGMGTVPNGTTITPGTNGAQGAWAQITAATTEDHWALMHGFQASGDTSLGNLNYVVGIGVGAAASEIVLDTFYHRGDNDESLTGPTETFPTIVNIPSGSRLAMRASNHSTPNDSSYNGVIHGLS